MIKLCVPGMIERRWGRIINITSTAANIGARTIRLIAHRKRIL
jgi:short-subunit dehydrogenase